MDNLMVVTVMFRDGWTLFPVAVAIPKVCPVCGGERGTPREHTFHEDGDWYTVDCWDNPCGHIDKYADVIKEAMSLTEDQGDNN